MLDNHTRAAQGAIRVGKKGERLYLCFCPDCKIGARLNGPQKGFRGALAPAGTLIDVKIPNACIVAAVKILSLINAHLNGCI